MKIKTQWILLATSMILGACSATGLSSPPKLSPEFETASNNYTEADLNALLMPKVTRGASVLSYHYDAVKCSYGTGTPSCTHVDLKKDADSTANQNNYYVFMNRNGDCLSSSNDQVKVSSCDVASDDQHFRLSYTRSGPREISVGDNSSKIWKTNAYQFAIIPKKNYEGDSQSYASGESYWLKKKNSENKIQQGNDCYIGNDKCTYRFYDATQWDTSKTYTMTSPDGSTTKGEYFLIQNHKFAQQADIWTSGKYYCLKEDNDKLKVSDSGDSYRCDTNKDKMLWRIMKLTITETPVNTVQVGSF